MVLAETLRCVVAMVAAALWAGSGAVLSTDAAPPVAVVIVLPAGPLPFGRALPLTVILEWDGSLVPEPFDETQFAPFVVVRRSVTRSVDAGRVTETRRYDACAFQLEPVALAPVRFAAVARDGRGRREAESEPLTRDVVGELDPAAPGAIEWPPGIAPVAIEPDRDAWWRTPVGAAGLTIASLAALAFVVAFVARRRTAGHGASAATDSTAARARQRLRELLASPPNGDSEAWAAGAGHLPPPRAAGAALADAVRELLEEERALPAPRRSREELMLLARAVRLPDDAIATLAVLLERGDAAKFATNAPTVAALAELRRCAAELCERLPEPQKLPQSKPPR
ncbi:MAG: hypothetical protein EXS13_08920 [Planctomycetes bacterium]|nr:hypothetical protein [Planctomycetota bacterium]